MQTASVLLAGITNGGGGFDALLNLDGVDGVYHHHGSAVLHAGGDPRQSVASSLLDEDGTALQANTGGGFDLASWGLGLPSVAEAASSVCHTPDSCAPAGAGLQDPFALDMLYCKLRYSNRKEMPSVDPRKPCSGCSALARPAGATLALHAATKNMPAGGRVDEQHPGPGAVLQQLRSN